MKKKSVLLIGLGRFGRHLAVKLNDLGHDVMMKFADRLSDIAVISDEPKLDGKTMTMMLTPKK